VLTHEELPSIHWTLVRHIVKGDTLPPGGEGDSHNNIVRRKEEE